MFRRVVGVAPIAALLAIGVPQPSADAMMGVPTQQSDDATVLVRERHRGGGGGGHHRGGGGHRSEHRGGESRGHHSERRGGDDGRRAFRDNGREFRRHHRGDDRDREFGFGRPYYDDYGDCGWLRRRAIETGSSYWWRRYRECRGW